LGLQTNIPFSGSKYESIYNCMKALMEELEGNAYHRRKFDRHLKSIAQQGRLTASYLLMYIFLIELIIGCSAQQIEAGILLIRSSLDWIRRALINYS
jgi:hypothetical protein